MRLGIHTCAARGGCPIEVVGVHGQMHSPDHSVTFTAIGARLHDLTMLSMSCLCMAFRSFTVLSPSSSLVRIATLLAEGACLHSSRKLMFQEEQVEVALDRVTQVSNVMIASKPIFKESWLINVWLGEYYSFNIVQVGYRTGVPLSTRGQDAYPTSQVHVSGSSLIPSSV